MIEGVETLMDKLNSIKKIETVLKPAVERAGIQVRDAAVLMCPVDTGELRQSIHVRNEISADMARSTVYTNKEYAAYVEFGTGPTGAKNHEGISPEVNPTYSSKGWSYMSDEGEFIHTNGQAATPFMYPALKNNEERLTENIIKEVEKELEKYCD